MQRSIQYLALLFSAGIGVLTLGCSDPAAAAKERAFASVKEHLNDPYSAKFEDVVVAGDPTMEGWRVCGYVNAKNAFGGYVGRKQFYVLELNPANRTVYLEGVNDDVLPISWSSCRQDGKPAN